MNGHKKERKPITEIDVAMILLLIFLALGALGFLSVIPRKFWLLPSLVLISYFCYKISEAIGEKQKGRQCTEEKSRTQETDEVQPAENGIEKQKSEELQPNDKQDHLSQ